MLSFVRRSCGFSSRLPEVGSVLLSHALCVCVADTALVKFIVDFLSLQAMKWTLGVGRNLPAVGTSISRSYATDGKLIIVIYTNQNVC